MTALLCRGYIVYHTFILSSEYFFNNQSFMPNPFVMIIPINTTPTVDNLEHIN